MEDKKKAGRKTTEAEYTERLNEALELILYKKLSAGEFRVTFSKMYKVSERTADAVWARAKQILKDRFTEKQEEIISEHLSRYYDLLERARQDNNKRVERETLADISKLYGLEQKKIDITSDGQPISINISLQD
jgi:hypothetical protein